MPGFGYSYVTDKAFVAFLHDLSEGAWKDVSITKHDKPDRQLAPAMLDASHPVIWKLRIAWAIASLKDALGSATLDKLDADWDSAQRRLHHQLGALAEDKKADVREAAGRLQGLLLQGGGTGQTSFDYDAEVDFGREQIQLTKEGQAAADVKKLKLGDLLKDIATTTEALAKGLGRTAGGKRPAAPSARTRDAIGECTAAFNGVHDDIAWFVAHTSNGPARDHLTALQAPFEALLARNPPPVAAKAAPGATPPAATPPAAPPAAKPA
jgi:hypothetical protein